MLNEINMRAVKRFHTGDNGKAVEVGEKFVASVDQVADLTRHNLAVPVAPEPGPQEKR